MCTGVAVQVPDERVVHDGQVAGKKLYRTDMKIIWPVERKDNVAVDVGALRPKLCDRREIEDNVGRPKGLVEYSLVGKRSQDWCVGRISLWLV